MRNETNQGFPKTLLNQIVEAKDQIAFVSKTQTKLTDALIYSIVMGEDVVLIGPPGIGKSRASNMVAELFPPGSIFRLNCNEGTTPSDLLGQDVIEARLKGKSQVERGGLTHSDTSLALLEEVFDIPPKALKAAFAPAADTPQRKISFGQYDHTPLALDHLHAIWGTTNRRKLTVDSAPVFDRILFHHHSIPALDGASQLSIQTNAALAKPKLTPLEKDTLLLMKKFTSIDDPRIIIPSYIERLKGILLTQMTEQMNKGVFEVSHSRTPYSTRIHEKATKLLKAAALLDGSNIVLPKHLTALEYIFDITEYPNEISQYFLGLVQNLTGDIAKNTKKYAVADIIFGANILITQAEQSLLFNNQQRDTDGMFPFVHLNKVFYQEDTDIPNFTIIKSVLEQYTAADYDPKLEELRQDLIRRLDELKKQGNNGKLTVNMYADPKNSIKYYDL